MKFTITHRNKKNQLLVSTKSLERFLGRIVNDDARNTVENFREYVPYLTNGYDGYKDMPTWMHVHPAAEFQKSENGLLKMKKNNGVLLLTFVDINEDGGADAIKQKVASLPSTLAAFVGADGISLHVLAKYALAKGALPDEEADADRIYKQAFLTFAPLYQTLVKAKMQMPEPSIFSDFLMTRDSFPYYREDALPLTLNEVFHGAEKPVESVDEKEADNSSGDVDNDCKELSDNIMSMIGFLCRKYDFRYNSVMKCTEYRPKEKDYWGYQPVDARVQKRMTLEVQLANIRVSIKDVRNYLESDLLSTYNPVENFLFKCEGKWDGKDHIRALARTVPTDNPYWEDWFYTWFLAMVDQWRAYSHRKYGNSVAPLLISKQGYNKSTFCRSLVPPELQWGYNDNLVLSEKRQVLQAMCQSLVINLDEFNQISPQVQQGFLKNIIQLPSVKIKPPYGSHVQEFPRMASFIATSNMEDILSDPSGNRRFLGVELTGPIDVSQRPNYEQLYAQALSALRAGEKTYFDAEQTRQIMANNRKFEVLSPVDQYFDLYFDLTDDAKQGEYLTAAEIFQELKSHIGSSLKLNSLIAFGRKLSQMPTIHRKRFNDGMRYLVVRKS
ncbi:VapE domain-containing protein [Segatella copri]|uniref:VapE domain-containing protein n=1 Tax=Segatella copri TaxID=165179 RepID=UPI001291A996|nr:VapE domain-containing protein [Segatella copri]MQM91549.1 helicase [Segatella copri]MQM96587.1 helicase [Segatella copri]MQN03665.1 helicase [Segatella copri]MQN16281.1 helicase [Segatella copri]MQN19532.1 helicase [Segatella copri]